jgi:ZIP family zinc transporter
MLNAFGLGAISQLSLILSGVVVFLVSVPTRVVGAASVVSKVHGARMAAFASGGILAMLSDSLIPFAHERSQGAGLWTVVGFCASFAIG